jgi:hypothetical protein
MLELKQTAKRLFADRDDPMVMSELTTVLGQLRQAVDATSRHEACHRCGTPLVWSGASSMCPYRYCIHAQPEEQA